MGKRVARDVRGAGRSLAGWRDPHPCELCRAWRTDRQGSRVDRAVVDRVVVGRAVVGRAASVRAGPAVRAAAQLVFQALGGYIIFSQLFGADTADTNIAILRVRKNVNETDLFLAAELAIVIFAVG